MLKDPVRKAAIVSGALLTIIGVLLIVWMQGFIDSLVRWWPAAFTVVGGILLFKAFFRKARPSALFVGLLMFLTGTFYLLLNTVIPETLTLKELWPVFMGIVGVSLIPYGARYRRTVRVTLVVPGLILIVLMGVFLLFSLQVVKQSFSDFVVSWWPLVLVFMGITLIASGWTRPKE